MPPHNSKCPETLTEHAEVVYSKMLHAYSLMLQAALVGISAVLLQHSNQVQHGLMKTTLIRIWWWWHAVSASPAEHWPTIPRNGQARQWLSAPHQWPLTAALIAKPCRKTGRLPEYWPSTAASEADTRRISVVPPCRNTDRPPSSAQARRHQWQPTLQLVATPCRTSGQANTPLVAKPSKVKSIPPLN